MVLRYSTAMTPATGPGGRRYTPMTTLVSAETTAPAFTAAPGPSAPTHDKALRAGALGLLSSVVIAVSSPAPAYSMAATLGLIVAVVGGHSPGPLIVSFLPMLC